MGHSPQSEPMGSHIQTKFTEGPWKVSRAEPTKTRGIDIVHEATGQFVAHVPFPRTLGQWNVARQKQARANANAIATFPDLFEILSIIVSNARLQPDASMNGSTDTYAVPLDDIEAARAVLAKATG